MKIENENVFLCLIGEQLFWGATGLVWSGLEDPIRILAEMILSQKLESSRM